MASQFLPFITGVDMYHYGTDTRRRASVLLEETRDLTRAILALASLSGEVDNGSGDGRQLVLESSVTAEASTG